MLLGILNLEEDQNCMIGSKVTTILMPFFFLQKIKNFKHRHVGCLSRGNWLEYWGIHLDFVLGECIWSEIPKQHFQSLKTYKIGVFGIKIKICSQKLKSESAAQYSSLLPLTEVQLLMILILKITCMVILVAKHPILYIASLFCYIPL